VIHSIRLTGHWTMTEVAPGLFRHARSFGAPRTVGESVWLAGTLSEPGTLSLNGDEAVGVDGAFRVEITARLRPRNSVAIDTAGTVSDTRVEIASSHE
jgi:hypothetical protein